MTQAIPSPTVLHDAAGAPAFAVLTWADWLLLAGRLADSDDEDDADDIAAFTEARAEDDGFALPLDLLRRIRDGENAIKVLRKWRGLDQAELAARIGSTQNNISQIETGARRGVRRAADFAAALDVPVELIKGWL